MTQAMEGTIRRELRSPRSAAIAGIIFSVLMITILALTTSVVRIRPEIITSEWLESWSRTAWLVINLVPFAGIAFLWFTGVIRDRLGEYEDKFFATIFLSSGIIQVGLFFLWGAIFGAIVTSRAVSAIGLADSGLYTFGFTLMNEIIGNYALRMAGVYMTAIASLWVRTGAMPRWLTIITYLLALGFLVAAERIREARFIFPGWVLLVSIHILVLNYRRAHHHPTEGETASVH